MTNSIHPVMPSSTHDEVAEQRFVIALKTFITAELDPALRRETDAAARSASAENASAATLPQLRRKLASRPLYQNWVSSMRAAQELMWQAAGDCVDRQLPELETVAKAAPNVGSVRTNPDFEVPRYLAASDTHMMPGSYTRIDQPLIFVKVPCSGQGSVALQPRSSGRPDE
ncbi:MAG: hypothetical protein IPG25_04980 [Proteobacteria bacterium]|nr:hypothetical protein [Pseudomonadota bacterium]